MATLFIAWLDIKRTVRERENVFWIFVAPLICAAFFGVLTKPSVPRPTEVAVVDQDQPAATARQLSAALAADGIRTRQAASAPAYGFCLIVPKGTGQALASGTKLQLVLKAGAEQTSEERRVQFKIQKALADLTLQGGDAVTNQPRAVSDVKPPLAVTNAELDVRRAGPAGGFQHTIPACLVMFTFMNLLVTGAGIAEERASGRFRRLATAPISFRQILLGKLLVRVTIGWAQMAYLLAFGVLAFGIRWGGNAAILFAFLSVVALAAGSLGLLIGTVFDDPDKCASLAVWSVMILSPLGGLWWPLEIVGPKLRLVANFLPTGWAMQATSAIMAFGAGLRDVAPSAAALGALFVISFSLAAYRLRRQVMA